MASAVRLDMFSIFKKLYLSKNPLLLCLLLIYFIYLHFRYVRHRLVTNRYFVTKATTE